MGNQYSRKKIEFIVNENGCHICTSHCLSHNGYPLIWINGKQYRINRYLWKKENGPIPEKMEVCHKCDNPSCINIQHFFLGTHQNNMSDKAKKGRGLLKLTREQIFKIREEGGYQKDIAKKYGIGQAQVSRIKNWKRCNRINKETKSLIREKGE